MSIWCFHVVTFYAPSILLLRAFYSPATFLLFSCYAPSIRLLRSCYPPSMRLLCSFYSPAMLLLFTCYAPSRGYRMKSPLAHWRYRSIRRIIKIIRKSQFRQLRWAGRNLPTNKMFDYAATCCHLAQLVTFLLLVQKKSNQKKKTPRKLRSEVPPRLIGPPAAPPTMPSLCAALFVDAHPRS